MDLSGPGFIHRLFVALSLSTLWLAGLRAQEPLAAPLPDRLSSDWWSYFAPAEPLAEEELKERIRLCGEALEQALGGMDEQRAAAIRPQAAVLTRGLNTFLAQKIAEVVPPQAAPVARESYLLTEALDRFRAYRNQDLELRGLREESRWQTSLHEQERRQQSQRRSNYLEDRSQPEDRFLAGLALMNARVKLETRGLELTRQERLRAVQEEALQQLEADVETISPKLISDLESLQRWTRKLTEAEDALEALQSSADAPREGETPSESGSPSPIAEERMTALQARRAVVSEALAKLALTEAEIAADQASIGRLLCLALLGREMKWEEVAAALERSRELERSTTELQEQARQILDRTRTAVGNQLAATDPDDPFVEDLRAALLLADSADQAERRIDQELAVSGFASGLLTDRLQQARGWVGQASASTRNVFTQAWESVVNLFRFHLFEINETPVDLLGLLRVAFILVAAFWISKLLRRALDRFGQRSKRVNRTSLYTVERIVHYLILAIGVMVGLTSIGLDLTKFALFASALGVGLGFGLQTLVSNFVAGLIILFEKSLNVGDFVELESGVTGEVREINMRSTLVTTNDNVDILVPNSEFVGGRVTNWTLREAFRRIHVPFGVAYHSDKDEVRKAVLEAADQVPWTLQSDSKRREPQVWLVNFGDSSLDFELVVWLTPEAVKRPARVMADFLWEIETSLRKHGIEIPFPQRDLHLRSGFPGKD